MSVLLENCTLGKLISYISKNLALISFLALLYTSILIFTHLSSIDKIALLIPSLSSPSGLMALLIATITFSASLCLFIFLPIFSMLSFWYIKKRDKNWVEENSKKIAKLHLITLILLIIYISISNIHIALIIYIVLYCLFASMIFKNNYRNNTISIFLISALYLFQILLFSISLDFISSIILRDKIIYMIFIGALSHLLLKISLTKDVPQLKKFALLLFTLILFFPFVFVGLVSPVMSTLNISSAVSKHYFIKDKDHAENLKNFGFKINNKNMLLAYSTFTLGNVAELCQVNNGNEYCATLNPNDFTPVSVIIKSITKTQ